MNLNSKAMDYISRKLVFLIGIFKTFKLKMYDNSEHH